MPKSYKMEVILTETHVQPTPANLYYPPPGRGLDRQVQRQPEEIGLMPVIIDQLGEFAAQHPDTSKIDRPRWALWRHGYLVHVEGDFTATTDVYSLRKTWHAMMVGAAINQGKIPSLHQKINEWQTELTGLHTEATWYHLLTQSAGFDYPYGDYPAFEPGQMWTYSDLNLVHLCHALAKVYGKKDFYDSYSEVARAAFFEAIGLEGWSTVIKFDPLSQMDDGVRFELSLDHMGRLGLLALARGVWDGVELIPSWFVEALETKQTYGMQVNYNGPNDGRPSIADYADRFPEAPYGYLTWVNTDGDFYPGADKAWAAGMGAGGSIVMWNRNNGLVFAANGLKVSPTSNLPRLIEQTITRPWSP